MDSRGWGVTCVSFCSPSPGPGSTSSQRGCDCWLHPNQTGPIQRGWAGQGAMPAGEIWAGHSLTLICDPKSRVVTLSSSFTDKAELTYLTLVFRAEGEQSLLVSVHSVSNRPLHSILNIFFFLSHICALCCWFSSIKWPKSIVLKCGAEALSTLRCALWRE